METTNSTKQPRDEPTKTRAQGGTDGTPTPTNNDQDNTTTDRQMTDHIKQPYKAPQTMIAMAKYSTAP